MATFDEIAQRYAAQLQKSAAAVVVKTASVQAVPNEFFSTVREIVDDLDTWQDDHGRPLDSVAIQRLCSGVDRRLDVDDGTLWEIKKGSVQSLTAYQNLALRMYYQLKSR